MKLFADLLRLMDLRMQTPTVFGWFHILWLVLTATAAVGLCLWHKKHGSNPQKVLLWVSLFVILLEVYKQVNYSFSYEGGIGFDYQWYAFPFQFCSTPMYVGLLAGLTKPGKLHEFSMYLEGKWYSLVAKEGRYDDNDPIGVLDVTILSNLVLDKVLGIKDLRTDKRIDFVGGIRGLGELSRRVDNGEMAVAFALYPVSMKQLVDIADSGNIMPPKTTWFEPKLRSGLAIHKLS